MKKILVTVQDESLLAVIGEVLDKVSAEMVSEPQPSLDKIEDEMPAVIIVDYSENVASAEALFRAVTEHEATAQIPFMFIIPEAGKWNEIEGFRLGFDTKVSKERPKLGIQLRLQAILKKNRNKEDITSRVKDLQQLMQAIVKKSKGAEDSGTFAPAKVGVPRAKLLIVEDEPLTRDVLNTALEKNYEIVFAHDGQQGLEAAMRERPDLIISDFMMPVMDGLQLLLKVRAHPDINRTPFLFLTAKNRIEDKIEGLEHGADEYLSKPFSVRELQLRVERLVDEGHYRRTAAGALQGQLAEVGLADVLQVISNNRKTGELNITLPEAPKPARLYFEDGQIINATFDKTVGLKALFRILTLDAGHFAFESKPIIAQHVINDKLENVLLEGFRQLDEFEMLRDRFPSGFHAVLKPGNEKAVQSGLTTVDALVLLSVGHQATVQEVLDKTPHTDFEVLDSIINLLDAGLLMTTD